MMMRLRERVQEAARVVDVLLTVCDFDAVDRIELAEVEREVAAARAPRCERLLDELETAGGVRIPGKHGCRRTKPPVAGRADFLRRSRDGHVGQTRPKAF